MTRSGLYWWAWNWRYRVLHPREALCDAGVWKCHQHPRMLWLASERRWAWRHKLRARRVARWSGWTRAELDAMLAPQRDAEAAQRAALLARLAVAMATVRERRRWDEVATTYEALAGNGLAPWQRMLLATAADARRLGQDIVVGVPRQW